jgi:hypothetical protein
MRDEEVCTESLKTWDLSASTFWSTAKVALVEAKAPPGGENCNLQDQKMADGCTLNCAGESKMEIPVQMERLS